MAAGAGVVLGADCGTSAATGGVILLSGATLLLFPPPLLEMLLWDTVAAESVDAAAAPAAPGAGPVGGISMVSAACKARSAVAPLLHTNAVGTPSIRYTPSRLCDQLYVEENARPDNLT